MQNDKKSKNYSDLVAGIVVMLLAAFFYWTTLGTKSFMKAGRGRLAPDAVPKAVAIAMFVLGIVIIVKWLIDSARGKVKPAEAFDDSEDCVGMTEEQVRNRHLFQKITMFFLTLQITLLSTVLSVKSWLKSALIALIASLAIFIIFGCAFGLAVPKVSFIDLGLGNLYRAIFG